MKVFAIVAGLAALLLPSVSLAETPGSTCGTTKETPCDVPLGSYYIARPATDNTANLSADGKRPVVFFFHGGGGWGSRILIMRKEMTAAFTARGYIVVAPNGKKRPGSRFGPGWSFIPQFKPVRDEVAFTKEILAAVSKTDAVDHKRILISGYSIGGSITSYLACREPDLAFAFAPVAGGFWRPHPEDCAGPVRLLHTHGWRDQTVPLEGRPLRQLPAGLVAQGDIFRTLNQWRLENDCKKYRADTFVTDGPFWKRTWTHCAPGTALQFALYPGGHEVPQEWPALAMDWFEGILAETGKE